jgi:hypothetical protein
VRRAEQPRRITRSDGQVISYGDFGAGPVPPPIRIFFSPARRAAIALGVMAVTAFLTAWFNLHPTRMEGSMRFDTKQLIERLTLALGVAAVGIALLATVARSSGDPILARHDVAVIAAADQD